MKTALAPGAGIPRLQELSYLTVAANCVAAGNTFDQLRRALIDHIASKRQDTEQPGNTAIMRLARHNPHRHFTNTTEALSELMRLGMVEKTQVPATKNAAAFYQEHTYKLKPAGEEWVYQLHNPATIQKAYSTLFEALWRCHPQFREYLRLLGRGMFVIPTAGWSEAQRVNDGIDERRAYIAFLSARAARAVHAGVTGWEATEEEIRSAISAYIEQRMTVASRRQRPSPYPRNRDFVNACEEGLVSFAFNRAGIRCDYISHEILRRWTKDLFVANFSYHVPAAPALRLWSTAEIRDDSGIPLVRRRTVGVWGDHIIDALPEAYEQTRSLTPGNSWVAIYRVRAAVCSQLGVNDPLFDQALQQFLAAERRPEAPFKLNLDPAEIGQIPPTERPLKLTDRDGRTQIYRVMTLIPISERRPV